MPGERLPQPDQTPWQAADTSSDAGTVYYRALRELGMIGRMQRVFGILDRQRFLMELGIRTRHPGYSREQVRLAVVRLRLGEQLFSRLFPAVDVQP
jgi:hypothetical protein